MRMIFNLRVHPFSVSQDDSLCAFIAVIPKYGTPCPSKPINVWNLKTLWKRRIPCSFLPFQGVFPWSKPPPKYIFLWPPKEDRNNKTRPPRPAVTCGVTWNSGGLPQLENVLPNRWEQSSSPFPGPGSEIYFFCDFYMLRIFSAIYSYRLGLTSPRAHERPKENIAVCQRLMIPVRNFYWSIDAVFAARQDFLLPFPKGRKFVRV